MEFALGRDLRFSDESSILEIVDLVQRDGFRARTLIHAIVNSEQFCRQRDETLK